MADAKEVDDRLFGEKALAAVESNDLISLRNMLDERLAEDPNAFRWGCPLHDALNKALELARYDMADALFQRGAVWSAETILEVVKGAREDNEWNAKAIDMALAHGWDINESNEYIGCALVFLVSCTGSLALDLSETACLKVAAHLLSKGANPNEDTQMGNNPLEEACLHGEKDMAALLLAHNATLERAPKALLHAAYEGNVDIMQMLLDHGADINLHPYGKYTTLPLQREREDWGSALHTAVKGGHMEAVEFLLEKGAAKDYRNEVGVTALDLAKKLGHEEIVRLLQ